MDKPSRQRACHPLPILTSSHPFRGARLHRAGGSIRKWTKSVILCFGSLALGAVAGEVTTVPLTIEPLTPIEGLADWDWTHARTTFVAAASPEWVTTMSQTTKLGSHGYHDIFESVSRDRGRTWTTPELITSLRRFRDEEDYDVAPGDLWPTYHAQTQCILATGKTFNFAHGETENFLREKVAYAVKDLKAGRWGTLRTMAMPKRDHSGHPILAPNAGCNQPEKLPNGDLLVPVRYQREADSRIYTSVVVRCRFNGRTLEYVKHGSELTIPRGRGLYEPSMIQFSGESFLTLRADDTAYVTKGRDGIHYQPIREWSFDDGTRLGSYNTQQHWVRVGGGLFLVYTRRGADNDHIFRHRAPLFIGQVDPERLVVLRETERVLLPENHACLGNSGICQVSDSEAWVTCGEVRVSYGQRKGENNRVLFARITADPVN